jgi:hypothetical protein
MKKQSTFRASVAHPVQPAAGSVPVWASALAGVGAALAVTAQAAPITQAGLTFSEVTAGITLLSASGSGSLADPIVLNEAISGGVLDEIVSISGLPSLGNLIGSAHTNGFALRKVVRNDTGLTWSFFDHELQEVLGTPSSNGDGLAFGQGFAAARPFTSDVFTVVNEIIDARDFVNFSGGTVAPGATVTFNFVITDNSDARDDLDFLRQRPNFRVGTVPVPGTLLLLGLGLGGLAAVARKR